MHIYVYHCRDFDYATDVLEHALPFAEYQYGKSIFGMAYRERGNGDKIDNWDVVLNLWNIYFNLGTRYHDKGSVRADQCVQAERAFSKSRKTLEPFRLHLALEISEGVRVSKLLTEARCNTLMELLTNSEESLARIYLDMGKHERGERHGMLALEYARKVKGDKKALKLYSALAACGSAVESLKRFSEACPFYEEAYTCLQGLYPPGHCELQHASVLLINSLINVSDFKRAETVARSTYAALIDPNNNVDPTSFEVASGARQLAQMCHLNGQRCDVEPLRIILLKEGEELARKALASVEVLFGKDSTKLGQYLSNLADLLLEQEKCDGESKAVLDRAYNLILEKEGLDGFHIMHVNHAYAVYHRFVGHNLAGGRAREEFKQSRTYYQETVRLVELHYGPTDVRY